jgi:3-oxoadipate enol-lactonase
MARMATRERVLINGYSLSYLDAGKSEDPAMVLLHAMGEDSSTWEPVLDGLTGLGYRVIAPDARGHGDSDRPGTYSYELLRDDVLGLLDTLGIGSCVLIGHSMGATTAGLVTIAAPARVSRLVLVDAVPPRPGSLERPPMAKPDHELPFDWPLVNALRAQLNDPDPAWWQGTLAMAVPTLVVAGGEPSHIPQADLHELAARLANGTLVEIPVGHMVPTAAPDAFVAAVADFLAAS